VTVLPKKRWSSWNIWKKFEMYILHDGLDSLTWWDVYHYRKYILSILQLKFSCAFITNGSYWYARGTCLKTDDGHMWYNCNDAVLVFVNCTMRTIDSFELDAAFKNWYIDLLVIFEISLRKQEKLTFLRDFIRQVKIMSS